MKIQIEKNFAEELVQQFAELANLLEQLKLGTRNCRIRGIHDDLANT